MASVDFSKTIGNAPVVVVAEARVIRHGNIIEKGGVNFSEVHGKTPDKILKSFGLTDGDFFATGVSIVLHPENPWVPIIHMNIRYFRNVEWHLLVWRRN